MKIVIAEDDDQSRHLLVDYLQQEGYDVIGVQDGADALTVISNQEVDVLITDLKMPKLDGIALLSKVKSQRPGITVLMMTGYASVNTAVKAMKLGAEEYLTKPINLEELRVQLFKAIEKKSDRDSSKVSPLQNQPALEYDRIIGESQVIKQLFTLINKVADSDSTIIINGESGTGKELVARAVHYKSYRRNKPLVPVNCGAIPEELLESELFGHEKGAFTGAYKPRIGRFELAHGGTIFLDEIGDMSPNLQVKILRVLQEQEFERVGGVKPVKVDIRIIAATHRDLEQAVVEGSFREDLYYRLNVIPITIPPLRERKADIPLLVSHFVGMFNKDKGKFISGVSPEAMQCMIDYHWPGNVRELQNIIERLVILKETGDIELADMPAKLMNNLSSGPVPAVDLPEEGTTFNTMVTSFEKQLILQALGKTKGVKNKAAKLLNMNRTTLVEKMKKLEIN